MGDATPLSKVNPAGFIDFAYGVNRDKNTRQQKFQQYNQHLKADGWQILWLSSELSAADQYGYKAVAMVNHRTQEVHISSAGTVPTHLYDLLDDIRITAGLCPNKLAPMQALVDRVIRHLDTLPQGAKGYRFSTSGHSLGAVVADLTAIELVTRGVTVQGSTTFENPGSAAAIHSALSNGWFSSSLDDNALFELQQRSSVWNSAPNCINTLQRQFAAKCHYVPPPIDNRYELLSPPARAGVLEQSSFGLSGFKAYLSKAVGAVAGTLSYYLGLEQGMQLKKAHSMENFKALDLADENSTVPVKEWPANWQYHQPLELDPIAGLGEALMIEGPNGRDLLVTREEESLLILDKTSIKAAREAAVNCPKGQEDQQQPVVTGPHNYLRVSEEYIGADEIVGGSWVDVAAYSLDDKQKKPAAQLLSYQRLIASFLGGEKTCSSAAQLDNSADLRAGYVDPWGASSLISCY